MNVHYRKYTLGFASLEKEQRLQQEISRILRTLLLHSEYNHLDYFIVVVIIHEGLEKSHSKIYWCCKTALLGSLCFPVPC